MMILRNLSIPLSLLFVFYGCKAKITGVPVPNQLPETFMVNVPLDSSDVYHAPILHWYGTDIDGYILKYEWTYDDTTTWNVLWTDSTLGTEDTIAFSAPLPDTFYTHIFYVRAIDNDEGVDLTPATRVFRTKNIPPVNTQFASGPEDSETLFVLPDTTATWLGITFEWETLDSDQVFPPEFSFAWDDTTTWSPWSINKSATFVGFPTDTTFTGYHTLYLRARDDALAMDTTIPTRTVFLVVPSLIPGVLVIDETGIIPGHSDSRIDRFYELMLVNAGVIRMDTIDAGKPPTHVDLSRYSTVLYHSDDISSTSPPVDLIADYLDIGGNFWLVGTEMANPLTLADVIDYFGFIPDSALTQIDPDFKGANPAQSGYPTLEIDTTKTIAGGKQRNAGIVAQDLTNPFDTLYFFDSAKDSLGFEGKICGIQYTGSTFKTVLFTFPLYYMKMDSTNFALPVSDMARDVLDFFGEP